MRYCGDGDPDCPGCCTRTVRAPDKDATLPRATLVRRRWMPNLLAWRLGVLVGVVAAVVVHILLR